MTFKILRSQHDQIDDFPAQAAAHAVAMKEWRDHMARVDRDKKNPDIDPIDRHWPVQRPDPHPLVAAAVNENDEMDYELVDDMPTPDQILRDRKNKLIDLVSAAEQTAVQNIIPLGRDRLFNMRETKIRARDNAVMGELVGAPTFLKKIKATVGMGPNLDDLTAEVVRRRTADDQAHLDDMRAKREAIEKIRTIGAIAHNAVEDLTAETIDAYKIPDFTKD